MIDQKLKDYRAEFNDIITENFTDKIGPLTAFCKDLNLKQDNLLTDLEEVRISVNSRLENFTEHTTK